jgi:hypothetical protein
MKSGKFMIKIATVVNLLKLFLPIEDPMSLNVSKKIIKNVKIKTGKNQYYLLITIIVTYFLINLLNLCFVKYFSVTLKYQS